MTLRTIESNRLVDWEKLSNLPADTNASLALKEDKANKGIPTWYASLGWDGKVPDSQLPATFWDWDVTAAANLWDNLLIRWDWATKWVQNSWISVDDSDNLTWLWTLNWETIATWTNTWDQDLSGKQDILAEWAFVDWDKTKLDWIEAWAKNWDFIKWTDTSISVVSNNTDNTLTWANQKENIDELDIKAIANAESNRVATNNQFTLWALLNNWFFEAHEFEVVVDGWVVYAEVWSSANAYAWGTTYNRWNQTIFNNVRYFSLVDSNTWNQPDTSPTEWEWITQADFNLHWFIEWSNRIFNLDTTTWSWVDWHARIALTAWTDAQWWEVRNYVWAEMNGTLDLHLVIGTTEPTWPAIVLWFADIPSVATTITQWVNNQQRYTNWLYKESIFKGQQEMLRDKARHRVTYESWVVPSMTITPNWGAIDSAIFNSTLWITHQLWEQIFPAFSGTPVFYVLNHPTNPPTQQYTDLNELDVDANWVTLRDNNDRYAFRVWGNQSSGTNSVDAIWITLPEGKYSTDNNALIDNQNFDITAISSNKVNTFFNIWRVVLKHTTANSWTLINLVWWTDVQDKRWEIIWAEWWTWWAVSSQTEFTDAEFSLRNATDVTKEVDFDLSWISTANKRTATMPDKDITIADDADVVTKLPLTWWSLTGALNIAKGSDIASATTTDIWAATWNFVDITWTITITGLWTITAWAKRTLQFDWILTFTHNASSLILPTGDNITTAAWDTCEMISLWSGNWICTNYQRADWTALASAWWGWSSDGFSVKMTSDTTASNNTYTKMNFTTEEFDDWWNWDWGKYTIPSDWFYHFDWMIWDRASSTVNSKQIWIYINWVRVNRSQIFNSTAITSFWASFIWWFSLNFTAWDFIEFYFRQSTWWNVVIEADYTYVSWYKIY